MILEAIITTENLDGSMHVSAIGPHVDEHLKSWTLKPFVSSQSFANMRATNRCVIHITDDARLLVDAIVGFESQPPHEFIDGAGYILTATNRAFALKLSDWQMTPPRASVIGEIKFCRELRPHSGWNRAKHAILEATIDATRIGLLPAGTIYEKIRIAEAMVAKTGGTTEEAAIRRLREFVVARLEQASAKE